MNNNLNERSNGGIIIAAIISAMVVLVTGLIAGLVLGIRSYGKRDDESRNAPRMSQYLLIDAADGLRRSASALRLSNTADSASGTVKNALVYATRAETALECDGGAWDEGREKEAFLNDAYALLSRPDPMHAVEKADELYRLSVLFCDSLNGGAKFEYNGELSDEKDTQNQETAAEYSEDAAKLVESVLGVEPQFIGGFGERRDFSVDRDGVNGYATVTGDKITEFSFPHNGGDGDPESAERLALETAEKCGFGELYVYGIERTDGGLAVKMCKACSGALCRDECAVAVVTGDTVVAFSAGKCGGEHELPDPEYTESQAEINAPQGGGEGRLVTINDGERDRICYEYRYELDDGEHFVYVCAQNGKQMGIR